MRDSEVVREWEEWLLRLSVVESAKGVGLKWQWAEELWPVLGEERSARVRGLMDEIAGMVWSAVKEDYEQWVESNPAGVVQ